MQPARRILAPAVSQLVAMQGEPLQRHDGRGIVDLVAIEQRARFRKGQDLHENVLVLRFEAEDAASTGGVDTADEAAADLGAGARAEDDAVQGHEVQYLQRRLRATSGGVSPSSTTPATISHPQG